MGDSDQPNIGQVMRQYSSPSNGSNRLVVPDQLGQQLAQVCADAIAFIDTALKDADGLDAMDPFSAWTSGAALGAAFSQRGTELKTILGDHKKILTDLGGAFVMAEKSYKAADGDGAEQFSKLKADPNKYQLPKVTADGSTQLEQYGQTAQNSEAAPYYYAQDWQDTQTDAAKMQLDQPPSSTDISNLNLTVDSSMSATPEQGVLKSWKSDYQAFADYTDNIKNHDKSYTWNQLSVTLAGAYGDLGNGLTAGSSQWSGKGKDVVIPACVKYAGSIGPLTTQMSWVGNTIRWSLGQIETAMVNIGLYTMDIKPEPLGSVEDSQNPGSYGTPGAGAGTVDDTTARADSMNIINTTYAKAITGAMAVMTVLSPAQSPLVQTTTAKQQPTTYTQPTTTTSTPIPTTTSQALTQQEQAAQQQQQSDLEQQEKQAQQPQQQATQQDQQQSADQSQQTLQQSEQALQQAAQQGLQSAQQAAQQGLQSAQQDAASAEQAAAATDGLGASALNGMAASALGGLSSGGLAGLARSAESALSRDGLMASRLFPRAAMANQLEQELAGEARAGAASATPGMGGMGPMGAGARGQGEKEKEKKRAEFLDSEEWLEKAVGLPPIVAKPVVEK